MMELYDYNNDSSKWPTSGLHAWAGTNERLGLHVVYTFAFLLLLRSDEVLKLRFEHITLGEEDGLAYIKVVLPFRKTEKFGGAVPLCLPTAPILTKMS
jgi:hypothetical protein